jgi:hypothetical protein
MLVLGAIITLVSLVVFKRKLSFLINLFTMFLFVAFYQFSGWCFAFLVFYNALDISTELSLPATLISAFVLTMTFPRVTGIPYAVTPTSATMCKSNLKNLGTALEMYSTDYKGKYPASLGALTPNYLKFIPSCRSFSADDHGAESKAALVERLYGLKKGQPEYRYVTDAQKTAYTVTCRSNSHTYGQGLIVPIYDSWSGLIESRPQ